MKHPLMSNNITRNDLDVLVDFLNQDPAPILTNSKKVVEFEKLWSEWLGVKYSVFVNSGSSANILTMAIIKYLYGEGDIITTPLGWVSDIASILHAGLNPVFCDINLKNLSVDENLFEECITKDTKALLLTHILGYNGLTDKILDLCDKHKICLIEDVCESHGATFKGKKTGSFGTISNFSFYYAHHMTSIEGGMICTNDEKIYQLARVFRSHGMLRESTNNKFKEETLADCPDLNQDFVFIAPTYNMRSTEINAVLAINQLKSLDANNIIRSKNLNLFLDNLDSTKYYTDFNREGNSNYAFTLLLADYNIEKRDRVESALKENGIEFRRGMSGGGNQLRQPYLKKLFGKKYFTYKVTDFVHHCGWYIGNYPAIQEENIIWLTRLLNSL
jgi:CDP-6-deoxy-D-xylo-4-hexulose-3-dehydrase